MATYDICVRGAGIVGRALALALSRQGLSVALQAPARAAAPDDVRAYALNAEAVALLDTLKVWSSLPEDARTAVHDMRIEGDAGAAHVLRFSAWEQAVRELAWIVDVPALEAALDAALQYAPHVTRVSKDVPATLLVLAEGRASSTRETLGVNFEIQAYGHCGLAARLATDRPHAGMARQWFRAPDVLALLPLDRPQPGHGLALVWSLPKERAQALLDAEPAEFETALMQATGGAAGTLRLASARAAWPLALARAERVCGPGWALVGDAAHLVHPLAGQGLNLGLGDVATLARVIGQREPWRSVGDERLLARYARERAAPTLAMARLTDGLLHLFAHPAPWVKELRNRGLDLVEAATPLKRWLAARAFGR